MQVRGWVAGMEVRGWGDVGATRVQKWGRGRAGMGRWGEGGSAVPLTEEEDGAADDDHEGLQGDPDTGCGGRQDPVLAEPVTAAGTHGDVEQLLLLPGGDPGVPQ